MIVLVLECVTVLEGGGFRVLLNLYMVLSSFGTDNGLLDVTVLLYDSWESTLCALILSSCLHPAAKRVWLSAP